MHVYIVYSSEPFMRHVIDVQLICILLYYAAIMITIHL